MDRRKVLLVAAVLMAVVGAGLVFLYAQDAEDRAAEQLDTVPVLVAKRQISTGESFTSIAEKVVIKQVPSSELLKGSTSEIDDFAGQYARMPILPNEQLVADKFAESSTLPLPDGTQGVMLDLTETERLAAFTQPGSRVTLYALPTEVDVETTEPALELEDVLVVSVGSRTLTPGGLADIDGQPLPEIPDNLVLVAVDTADAQRLLNYATSDEYTIQFSVPASDPDAPAGDGTE